MAIANKIDRVRNLVQEALSQESAYPFLPEISEILEAMSDAYKRGEFSKCRKFASGLGRLITDNIDFMESSLGRDLAEIATAAINLPPEASTSK